MRNRRAAGMLFLLAGALFIVAALLEGERRGLRLMAGGVLMLAGVAWLVRAGRR